MERVFLAFDTFINKYRQVQQRQRIKQSKQPVGTYRWMNRAEEQEGDDASAQALCAEQNGIPPPKDSPLADTDKKHTCGKHQKQDGRTKGRKEPG